MECIICKDAGEEPLLDNSKCSCKYKYHNSCWIDYVHSRPKLKCLLCSKEYTNKKETILRVEPYIPSRPSAPALENSYQVIEEVRTVRRTGFNQTSILPNLTNKQKLELFGKCLILVGIIVVIIVIGVILI